MLLPLVVGPLLWALWLSRGRLPAWRWAVSYPHDHMPFRHVVECNSGACAGRPPDSQTCRVHSSWEIATPGINASLSLRVLPSCSYPDASCSWFGARPQQQGSSRLSIVRASSLLFCFARRGCWAVDAPVSGGDKGAREGALAIMAGGASAATVGALEPLWQTMGRCTYLGPPGSGQHCKLANQVRPRYSLCWLCVFGTLCRCMVRRPLPSISE